MDSSAITLLVILLIIFLVIVFIIKHKIIIGAASPSKKFKFSLSDDIVLQYPAQKGFSYNIEKFREIYADTFYMEHHSGNIISFEISKQDNFYYLTATEHDKLCFKLSFIDVFVTNNDYSANTINYISKTDNLTHIEVIAFALRISKEFGANKTILKRDEMYNLCQQGKKPVSIPVSPLWMLQKYKTYYTELGFKFLNEEIEQSATQLVDYIRTIKSTEFKTYYEQLIENMEMNNPIFVYSFIGPNPNFYTLMKNKDTIIKKYKNMVDILNKYNSNKEFDDGGDYDYFYKLIIYLFEHKCGDYYYLYSSLINDYKRLGINDNIFENIYSKWFTMLHNDIIYESYVYCHNE